MSQFHSLKVKRVERNTHDSVLVSLDVPTDLREAFRFTHGQYLTFRKAFNGQEERRSYSLCTSPLDNEWRVAIKQVPGGLFSCYAIDELKAGDTLDVMTPEGRFTTALDAKNAKVYAFFAAGSGITPVFSILRSVLLTEPNSQVYLFYGNRGRNSIILKEEIEALKNLYVDRLSVYHILSREVGDTELFHGRIDKVKTLHLLDKLVGLPIDEAFVCGPEEMIHAVREAIGERGLAEDKVHFELFTTDRKQAAAAAAKREQAKSEEDKTSRVTVILDGNRLEMDMSYYGDTILDAAAARGADVPYSCKGGVCSTCRAKVVDGTVEMDVNYSLTDREVANGFILTCQARPTSPCVTVDFDH